MNQGTVDFPLRVVELNLLALASDFVDYQFLLGTIPSDGTGSPDGKGKVTA